MALFSCRRSIAAAALAFAAGAAGCASAGDPRLPQAGAPAAAGHATAPFGSAQASTPAFIYVTNHGSFGSGSSPGSVTVYPASAAGNATPVATLAGKATKENEIQFPAVDGNGTLWISNVAQGQSSGYVSGFAAGAQSGDVKPKYTIKNLNSPEGIAVGPNNELAVGTIDCVNFYATHKKHGTLEGTIAGSNTDILNTYEVFYGNGNLYLAEQDAVYVYPFDAQGNVAPSETITGTATMLQDALGTASDSAGNIYATNLNANDVVEFAEGANGDATPTLVVTGSAFDQPWGIFVDGNGTVYVANRGNNSIAIFSAAAFPTGIPTATISGAATGLDNPIGVFVK